MFTRVFSFGEIISTIKKLLQQIEITNRRRQLICSGDSIVVGLSGGPDSIALIELLSRLRRKYSLNITAAHLDHNLSAQSGQYLSTAKKTAQKLGILFYVKNINLKSLAKNNGRSLEEMGRLERYDFFEEVADKSNSRKIATAHTLDDQAETMLMRIFRGSGLRGLVGIPYLRPQGKFHVIRPLLDCSKKDLLRFLGEENIPFCVDKSNRDPMFTRNRVRHGLLPQVEHLYNPQVKQSLASLQAICSDAQDYLDRICDKTLKKCLKRSAGSELSLDTRLLRKLHPAILSGVLFKALSAVRGDSKRFGYEHLAVLSEALVSEEDELEMHLPNEVRVKKKSGTLTITSLTPPRNKAIIRHQRKLSLPK